MPHYTLRVLGDDDVPARDVEYATNDDLEVGSEFLLDEIWRHVAAIEPDPDIGTVHVVRSATPLGAFTIGNGDTYVAEIYDGEARMLLRTVQLNRAVDAAQARVELETALENLTGGAGSPALSRDAITEIAETIQAIQLEHAPLPPGLDWLRIQVHRYLEDHLAEA